MLLGYNQEGEIKFIFTDEKYLDKKYPNNTAKISNFWGTEKHGLTEFFISIKDFKEWDNAKTYKIVNKKLIKKTSNKVDKKQPLLKGNNLSVISKNIKPEGTTEIRVK